MIKGSWEIFNLSVRLFIDIYIMRINVFFKIVFFFSIFRLLVREGGIEILLY